MGVLPSDIVIKTAIEAALADLRKNNWILDDVFGDLGEDRLSQHDYGWKFVQRAKEWFLNNNIEVYQQARIDTPKIPCITVVNMGTAEKLEAAALSDEGGLIEEIDPMAITKRIQKVLTEFTPVAYDPVEGFVTLPQTLTTEDLAPGQFLVTRTNKAYVIEQVLDLSTIKIKSGIKDNLTDCYIAPATSIWNLHRGITFLNETYSIGIHAQSDINQAIWLRSLMIYILMRYKEPYLDRRGVELSTFSVGAIDINSEFRGAELVWSCYFSMTFKSELTFIEFAAPKIQQVRGGIRIMDGPKTPDEMFQYAERQGWKMEADPPQPEVAAKKPKEQKEPE